MVVGQVSTRTRPEHLGHQVSGPCTTLLASSRGECGHLGKNTEEHQLGKNPGILGSCLKLDSNHQWWSSISETRSILASCLVCRQHVEEGAECPQARSHPQLPPPVSPERGHASTATKQLHRGCFIYGFNNGVSWEIFGFSFPEAKTHLQNVLEIYYYHIIFSYHII